jgi:hypothetical protein
MARYAVQVRDRVFFDSLRHELKGRVRAKLGHVDEAVARAFRRNTRAALLADIAQSGTVTAAVNEERFIARLTELGGDAPRGALVDAYLAVWKANPAIVHCAPLLKPEEVAAEEAEWGAAGEEDEGEDGWVPPWELDEDDPLRWSWEHDMNSRRNR